MEFWLWVISMSLYNNTWFWGSGSVTVLLWYQADIVRVNYLLQDSVGLGLRAAYPAPALLQTALGNTWEENRSGEKNHPAFRAVPIPLPVCTAHYLVWLIQNKDNQGFRDKFLKFWAYFGLSCCQSPACLLYVTDGVWTKHAYTGEFKKHSGVQPLLSRSCK